MLPYIKQYIFNKAERRLYQRYVANSIGAIAQAKITYDSLLNKLIDKSTNKKKRSAEDIRKDLLLKFNTGGKRDGLVQSNSEVDT